jgi:hypothetical protein
MKKIGIIAGIIILAFLSGLLIRKCKPDHSGLVLVKQSFLDSLAYIASLPPDTVVVDSIIKGDPVYVPKPYPVPVYVNPADTSLKNYADSIKNDSIDVRIDLKVKGRLLDLEWLYTPITKEKIVTIEKKVPFPVEYKVAVPIPQRGLFISLGLGAGIKSHKPVLSGELSYLMRSGGRIGIEAGYFQDPYFKANFGTKIKFKP